MPTLTIVFTDVSQSTQHLVDAGDAEGVAEMTQHFRHSRQIVESHGGRVAKTLGDGVMALFHSASEAVARGDRPPTSGRE